MTQENSQPLIEDSGRNNSSKPQQEQQKTQQPMQSSLLDSVASAPTKRQTSSLGGRSACGTLIQRRHTEANCSQKPDATPPTDAKDRTLSGLEESGRSSYQPSLGTTDFEPTPNEISTEEGNTRSSETEGTSRLSSLVLKKQVIVYEGKLVTVYVQVWPCAHRIPVHERHRLQEPMKHRYGKLSLQARLLKDFERNKIKQKTLTIPLLPRQVREEARLRLMSWYRPLKHQSARFRDF